MSVSLAGLPSGYERENEHLIFEMRDQRAALGNRGDKQRRLAHRDRFAARLRVAGGIFDRGLDQHPGRALAERSSGKVSGQLEIEVIGPVAVGLALAVAASKTATSMLEAFIVTPRDRPVCRRSSWRGPCR